MRKIKIIFFIVCFPCLLYAQQGIDKYDELKKNIINEDYESFKINFDKYEVELKSQNSYNQLANIYSLALIAFEKNEIFNRENLEEKLKFILNNKSRLSKKEKIDFECTLVEFYFVTRTNLQEALSICNRNIETDEIEIKLFFYRFKSSIVTLPIS